MDVLEAFYLLGFFNEFTTLIDQGYLIIIANYTEYRLYTKILEGFFAIAILKSLYFSNRKYYY